jgi:hypothetical protein
LRNKIRLDTSEDAKRFVEITSLLPGRIVVKDPTGLCVNAKSVLGALHAMEFSELWLESENDIYMKIQDFIIIE